jgi:hypothetical protein
MYVRPFVLDEAYQTWWRKERPFVRSGYIVVLRVVPAVVVPKATAEPVLYAGDQTVERINIGQFSGYVVGIVPGEPRLKGLRFWFGEPGFPESVDADLIARERAAAEVAGVGVIPNKQMRQARAAGGRTLHAANKSDLLDAIAPLILEYSPQEKRLANMLRGHPPGD